MEKDIHKIIPGGCHTYSKGDDQFPENCPKLFKRGEGCKLYDENDIEYIDYGMGLRSVTLGYSFDYVNKGAIDGILKGNNLTKASLIEYDAAKIIINTIPCAEMVKFAKNGSNVTTAAIKLSRAYTNRKIVLYCKTHPFFSFDDWFIGTTVANKGVPEEHYKLSKGFEYNNFDQVKKLFEEYKNDIACVILEPVTNEEPKMFGNRNFLQKLFDLCEENSAVLILDEMITGFRFKLEGASDLFGVKPHLATFGKGVANGFSVACLVGKKEIMSMGGITEENNEKVFLLSSTHGAEMSSLGAMINTIKFYKENKVIDHIWEMGNLLKNSFNELTCKYDIQNYLYMEGYACSPIIKTLDKDGNFSYKLRTFFLKENLDNKLLIPYISISYSHKRIDIEKTILNLEKTIIRYKEALENPRLLANIKSVKPVFRKYN